MKAIVGFMVGMIFAIGLVVSGMTNPDKVIGFLDILGEWDYALMFVMGGAVMFNLLSFTFIKKKDRPLLLEEFEWPQAKHIDAKLLTGAAIFGIGWGIAGICPGPGVVNLVLLDPKAIIFVVSMVAGMLIFKLVMKSK